MQEDYSYPQTPPKTRPQSFLTFPTYQAYRKMSDLGGPSARGNGGGGGRKKAGISWVLIASYALDWIVMIAADAVGFYLGNITPNRRPFSLSDPNISYVLLAGPRHHHSLTFLAYPTAGPAHLTLAPEC